MVNSEAHLTIIEVFTLPHVFRTSPHGLARSPTESELIFAESESVRTDWLVPIWQGHLCNRARTPCGVRAFMRTPRKLGSDWSELGLRAESED
jgi:hypothetical protein